MRTVLQTNFNGIDALTLATVPRPKLTATGVLIKMQVVPVVPSDWKRETNPAATQEQLTDLPRPIGIGGVGQVVAVGAKRDPALFNPRVFVLQPTGSYADYIVSENPDFIFPLPATVTGASAAALTAGPGTAWVLQQAIMASATTEILITGANSVIGLYLLQLLQTTVKRLYPLVTADSQAYFKAQCPNQPAYTPYTLPHPLHQPLHIAIACYLTLLVNLTQRFPEAELISIAYKQKDLPHLSFVHEQFEPQRYRQFIQQLAVGRLIAPIDRTFPIAQVKQAQHYAQDHHSRGRVLVAF